MASTATQASLREGLARLVAGNMGTGGNRYIIDIKYIDIYIYMLSSVSWLSQLEMNQTWLADILDIVMREEEDLKDNTR